VLSVTLGDKIYLNFGNGGKDDPRIGFTHTEWAQFRLWMTILGIQVEKEIEELGHRDGYDGEPVTLIGGNDNGKD
jgi:hypothetical protein